MTPKAIGCIGDKKEEKNPKAVIMGKALTDAFPSEWLRETARTTGLIKRERKIDPVKLFWAFVFTIGVSIQRTLATLKRNYLFTSKGTLSDSSWYERFSPELATFIKECVLHGIEHLAASAHRDVSDRLKIFKDVMIQDSTVIRLHEKLAKTWPATRTRKIAAGVKVSLLVSAFSNSAKSVTIHGERVSEIKTLRIGPWVKDRILLIDLGFYKHQVFTRIKENGGYFISRLKDTADPMILSPDATCPGNSIKVQGKQLRDILPKLRRQVLDVEIEIKLKRRRYAGKQSMDTDRFRLVAVYNTEERRYHLYITNITPDKLTSEEVARLYSARWEIELIFKELKSRYALDKIATTKTHIVEAIIWTAILTLLVSRIVYTIIRHFGEAEGKPVIRFTQLRWSTIFVENAERNLMVIMYYLGMEWTIDDYLSLQTSGALDPHVNRARFREEWWS